MSQTDGIQNSAEVTVTTIRKIKLHLAMEGQSRTSAKPEHLDFLYTLSPVNFIGQGRSDGTTSMALRLSFNDPGIGHYVYFVCFI